MNTSPDQSRPPAPPEAEVPDLEDYKLASFIHAANHDQAGTDFELCDDDDCPHWPTLASGAQPRSESPYITGLEPPLLTDLERQLTWEIEVLQANYDVVLAQRDRYLEELQQTRAVVTAVQNYLAAGGPMWPWPALDLALDALSAGSSRPAPESEP